MNKGIVYILISGIAFMVVNLFVKILASGPSQQVITGIQSYPVPEIILFRSLITFLICCAVIRVKKIPFFGVNKKWLLIRGVFGTTALTMFFFTLDNLPIAVATTVQYLSPVFTVIIATFLVSEKVRKIQWIFMLVAFSGIAMLGASKFLSQNTSVSNIDPLWVLLGVLSAVLSGVAYNAIVKCQNTDHPVTVVMYFPLIATPIMLAYVIFVEFVMPQGVEWLLVLIIGVFTQIAQIFMTKAFHSDNTATITPFKYFGSIYAFFIGLFLFGEVISFYGIASIILILIGVLGNALFKNSRLKIQMNK
ncbi:MAG: DMT family transporter [Crocinitomicaceae bacterium]|nr:DMT family transporter [Crocinitomicaceae bacterium]